MTGANIAGICWSFIPLGIRHFSQATIWQILLFRPIGLLPMIAFLIWRRSAGRSMDSSRAVGVSGIVGGLGLVAAYAGGIGAVRMTSIANAAFLFATAPFLAAFLGQPPGRNLAAIHGSGDAAGGDWYSHHGV